MDTEAGEDVSISDLEQEVTPALEASLLKQYRYMRFSLCDLNGISRGKIVPMRHALKYLKTGVPYFAGETILPADSSFNEEIMEEALKHGAPNGLLRADLSSIHAIPWADVKVDSNTSHFCEVFCDLFFPDRRFPDFRPQWTCPRYVALQLIQRLETEFGLTMKSAFEAEVTLMNKKDRSVVFEGNEVHVNVSTTPFHPLLVALEQGLSEAGVDVEGMHLEYEPGQFEFNISPASGIQGADQLFILKQGLHEMCAKRDLIASFMSQLIAKKCGNGTHFNFSLLDKDTGKNVFGDASQKDGMSMLARRWLAGLIRYGPSLCLMFAPTFNCYRRFTENDLPPTHCHWGIDFRMAAFRVKVDTPTGVYMENRIPSGLCNPYAVLAATLAAGMQGLRDQLECPPAMDEAAPALPKTLEEALNKLEADDVMKKALGAPLVDNLIKIRRLGDLKKFKDVDASELKPEDILKEAAYYEGAM